MKRGIIDELLISIGQEGRAKIAVECENGELSDEYLPTVTEDTYAGLVRAGKVLDESGAVQVKRFTEAEKIARKTTSLPRIRYVSSGRGLYGAWRSNLQKCIRKGLLRDALKSAVETAGMGGVFWSNIANRLCRVIVSEDIGCADPWLAVECAAFLARGAPPNSAESRAALLRIVTLQVAARKSRAVDYLLHRCATVYPRDVNSAQWDVEFSEFRTAVLEAKTDEDLADCANRLCRLVRTAGNLGPGEKLSDGLGPAFIVPQKHARKRKKVYKVWLWLLAESRAGGLGAVNGALLEIYSTKPSRRGRLLITHALANLIQARRGILPLTRPVRENQTHTWGEIEEWDDIWPRAESYDRHVLRSIGRGSWHFLRHGALLANKAPELRELDTALYNQACLNVLKRY